MFVFWGTDYTSSKLIMPRKCTSSVVSISETNVCKH